MGIDDFIDNAVSAVKKVVGDVTGNEHAADFLDGVAEKAKGIDDAVIDAAGKAKDFAEGAQEKAAGFIGDAQEKA
ncbi:MAG TPA: hypothetical protein PKG79_05145, partial [Propioniciclava tarda]|nr:hypothetical protein [Propioniciclava tarda]